MGVSYHSFLSHHFTDKCRPKKFSPPPEFSAAQDFVDAHYPVKEALDGEAEEVVEDSEYDAEEYFVQKGNNVESGSEEESEEASSDEVLSSDKDEPSEQSVSGENSEAGSDGEVDETE